MTDEATSNNGTEIVVTDTGVPNWFIDEGIPGVGVRPDWLPTKFKSTADLAKSYNELEKRVGTAPEEYDLSKSKFIDPDYAPIQDFMAFAKDKRVPQEVMDKMVDAIDKYMGEFTPDAAEEMKLFGDNANERLTTLDNWAKANLSDGAVNALMNSLKSADAIKALEEIRGKMMNSSTLIPAGNDGGVNNTATLKDLQDEMGKNLQKYTEDPVYRREWQARLAIAAKSSGAVDKVGG